MDARAAIARAASDLAGNTDGGEGDESMSEKWPSVDIMRAGKSLLQQAYRHSKRMATRMQGQPNSSKDESLPRVFQTLPDDIRSLVPPLVLRVASRLAQ